MNTPRHSATPLALLRSAPSRAGLIWQFARRELSGRYRGSLIGFGWAILNPLLLLAIYTFVFSVVFRIRWDGPVNDRFGFALVVYAGMIVHGFFAECILRAPSLMLDNRNLVKKVVFPLEVLPWSVLAVAGFHLLVGAMLIAIAVLVTTGALPASLAALPLIVAPLALVTLGFIYAFAALGVYLRDLNQVVGFFALTLLFLSPIFYPVSAVPVDWRWVITLNPIAHFIEMTRGVMIYGTWPPLPALAAMWAAGAFVAWLGFFWFQKTRKGFADVL